MNKELLPIIISFASIVLASLSLGWNIYRDIILKAKLKVRFMVGFVTSPVSQKPLERLVISATNFGPGKIRGTMLFLKESSLWKKLARKTKYAALIHDYTDRMSGNLPCELEIGEGRDFLLKFEKDCFLSEEWTHIGIKDSFGRIHWAPKCNVKIAREMYKKQFCEK